MRQSVCVFAIGLSACASSPDSRIVAAPNSFAGNLNSSVHITDSAYTACDTRKMRRRAFDQNPYNDNMPITVISSISEGTRMMIDMDVDCRDVLARRLFFENDSTAPASTRHPNLISQSAEKPSGRTAPKPQQTMDIQNLRIASSYQVELGDTLYSIGRKYCTDWQTLATLNSLKNPTQISQNDIIALPEGRC